jgi:uncharacterized protein (TIGR02266 family)
MSKGESAMASSSREKREFPRVPLNTEVLREFADIDELAKEYCDNLSLGGMFIKSPKPLPVGTTFAFELKTSTDGKDISGTAKVEWVRDQEDGEEAIGMGVRFIELKDNSLEIIFRIVDKYIQEAGGEPFELEKGQ